MTFLKAPWALPNMALNYSLSPLRGPFPQPDLASLLQLCSPSRGPWLGELGAKGLLQLGMQGVQQQLQSLLLAGDASASQTSSQADATPDDASASASPAAAAGVGATVNGCSCLDSPASLLEPGQQQQPEGPPPLPPLQQQQRQRYSIRHYPALPVALSVLGSGPHSLDTQHVTGEVVISRKAGEAVLRGAHVFVPGVLAATKGLESGDRVVVTVEVEQDGRPGFAITRGTTLPPMQQQAQWTAPQQCSSGGGGGSSSGSGHSSSGGGGGGGHSGGNGWASSQGREVCPANHLRQRHGGGHEEQPSSCPACNGGGPQDLAAAGGTAAAAAAAGAGSTAAAAAEASSGCSSRQRLCVGIGTAQLGRAELFRLQAGVAVVLEQRVFDVPALNGVLPCCAMLQNLPSIVAGAVLAPAPGSRVLDMCAAPGGKTSLLAQLMGNKGEVIALDRSHAKVDQIVSLAADLGCSIVKAYKMDATQAVARRATSVGADGAPQSTAATTSTSSRNIHSSTAGDCHNQQQQQEQQPCEAHQSVHEAAGSSSLPGQGGQQQQQEQQQEQQEQRLNGGHLPSLVSSSPAAAAAAATSTTGGAAAAAAAAQLSAAALASNPPLSSKAQQRLKRRLAAMAARGHTPTAAEFRNLPGAAPARHPGFPPGSFDCVLLDAPCTALGIRPRLLLPHDMELLQQTAAYQRQLLDAAVRLLRAGGTLVYSTCSISPGENEVNVRYALDTYPCLKLVPATPRLGGPGLTGPADPQAVRQLMQQTALANQHAAAEQQHAGMNGTGQQGPAEGEEKGPGRPGTAAAAALGLWSVTDEEAAMMQRFDPCVSGLDTIGFFIAKFVKQ